MRRTGECLGMHTLQTYAGATAKYMLVAIVSCFVDSACITDGCLAINDVPCRCSQDLVEVPSHLWEHFANDERSLSLLARHRVTRDAMPQLLASRLRESGLLLPALELQQQVRTPGTMVHMAHVR